MTDLELANATIEVYRDEVAELCRKLAKANVRIAKLRGELWLKNDQVACMKAGKTASEFLAGCEKQDAAEIGKAVAGRKEAY